jgi:hypothetical protein
VNLGVQLGRKWCIEQGIPLDYHETYEVVDPTLLSFTEEMKGHVAFGETDYDRGLREGSKLNTALMVHLTIALDGVHHFVTDPRHQAKVEGYVQFDALGGRLPIERGVFNLFVDEGDPTLKKMLYRLYIRDSVGHPVTLSGFKLIRDDPHFDIWTDTTTLFTHLLKGHVEQDEEAQAEIVASGIITIHYLDFLKQLMTFHVEAPTPSQRLAVLSEFGTFFLGKLWDVYAQKVLSYGPF